MKRTRSPDVEAMARDRNRGTTNFVTVEEGRVPHPSLTPTTTPLPSTPAGGGVCVIGRDGVLPGPEWVRLDEALRRIWPERYGKTLSSAKKAIRGRGILVAGSTVGTCSHAVLPGTRVERMERVGATSHKKALKAGGEEVPRVDVIFEDDHHAVIYKPPGMTCDHGVRRGHGTVTSAILVSLKPSPVVGALGRPKHAHRLDLPTEGLLLCAKSKVALVNLSEAFAERKIHKRYRALVFGTPEEVGGVMDGEIGGKACRSEWRRLDSVPSARFGSVTRVDLWPVTGRKHQLRKHLSALRHPIIGDDSYGFVSKVLHGKGLFLAAVELEYPDPITGEVRRVKVDEPKKYGELMAEEKENYDAADPSDRFNPSDAHALLRLGTHFKSSSGSSSDEDGDDGA